MKRLILNPKMAGGVGATTATATLVELGRLNEPGLRIAASDGNSELGKFYTRTCQRDQNGLPLPESQQTLLTGCLKYSFLNSKDISNFSQTIDEDYDVMVMDLPGGSTLRLLNLTDAINADDLLYWAEKMGIRLTIIHMVTPMVSSLYAMRQTLNAFGDSADHVAIKNLFHGRECDFLYWNKEEQLNQNQKKEHVRDQFQRLGGVELTMPSLPSDTYSIVDARQLSFVAGSKDLEMGWGHRANLLGWLRHMIDCFSPAADALGFPNLSDWKYHA